MKECCGRTPAECRRLPRVASRVVSGPVDNGRYLSVLSHLGGRPAGCPILSRGDFRDPSRLLLRDSRGLPQMES
jgi:hypothetical protein